MEDTNNRLRRGYDIVDNEDIDREDIDIKCIDVKWGNTPRNHLRPEVPRHKKLLDRIINMYSNESIDDPDSITLFIILII